MKFRKHSLLLSGLLAALVLSFSLVACAANTGTSESSQDAEVAETSDATAADEASADETTDESSSDEVESPEAVTVHVGALKGPTSIGLVDFMDKAESGDTTNSFEFTMTAATDEIVSAIATKQLDIALVPANLASVLYNKTEGGVQVIDINTLGVLYAVSTDSALSDVAGLSGKTIYMTGKGATPEYTLGYLLDNTELAEPASIEFKDEATEVVAALAANPEAVAILPEPFATAASVKNEALVRNFALSDEWNKLVDDGSQIVTGVTIVRSDFLQENPEAVAEFIAGHHASVEAVNADPAAAATLVVARGIIEAEPVAAKAIPNCALVCITGPEMQTALEGYYGVLYRADPSSVGGELPDANFYWLGA